MECARDVAGIMMGAMACQKAAAPVEAGGFAGGEVIKEGASCSSMHFTLPRGGFLRRRGGCPCLTQHARLLPCIGSHEFAAGRHDEGRSGRGEAPGSGGQALLVNQP
jgi:hypothetical protein